MRTFITTGLLLCLAVGYVLSEPQEECLSYRLESLKYIHIDKESGARNLMRINMDILMRPYRGSRELWTLDMRNPEVFIDREKNSQTIELNKCPSNAIPATLALLPTLVVFKDGLLKEIRVDRRESEVAINVKLYIASLMQININALRETKTPVNTGKRELLYVGECPVTYELRRDHDKKGESLRLIKRWKLDECDDLRRSSNNDGHQAESTERSKKIQEPRNEEEDVVSGIQLSLIRRRKGLLIPELVLFNASVSYRSERNAGDRLRLDADVKLILKDIDTCDNAPNFINTNAEIVTRQVLRPVNEKLLAESDDTDRADLRNIYKGLASDGTATNIYQDLYERALRCWEVVP